MRKMCDGDSCQQANLATITRHELISASGRSLVKRPSVRRAASAALPGRRIMGGCCKKDSGRESTSWPESVPGI